jgi:hypothetical protein
MNGATVTTELFGINRREAQRRHPEQLCALHGLKKTRNFAVYFLSYSGIFILFAERPAGLFRPHTRANWRTDLKRQQLIVPGNYIVTGRV